MTRRVKKVKNTLFFNIRDSTFAKAEKLIKDSTLAELLTCYKQTDQTTLFFAAARQSGEDEHALELCRLLLERGVPVDHVDDLKQSALFYAAREGHANTIRLLLLKGADPDLLDSNGETAIFYAVSNQKDEAVKALLEGGATLEVVNNWHDTCMSKSPTELLPILEAERKKRRGFEDTGSGTKRRRTGVEELRSWAHEWPIKEKVVGEKIDYKQEDIVLQSTDGMYAVVKNAPEVCAARLRVLEKNFVVDHAELLGSQPWFGDLTPQEWCKNVGVIADELGNAVDAIKTVVSGNNPQHFTLPLLEAKSQMVAGYVHATHTPEKNEMSIAHLKVDAKHMGQGLGGLLIEAAENHSKDIGWLCKSTYLSVLKANVRARRCYAKAGFKVQSSRPARWGSKEHTISAWERWRKVETILLAKVRFRLCHTEAMTRRVKVKNTLFFNIRDSTFAKAEKLIKESSLAELHTCYKKTEQTTLFFAAARQSGEDEHALELCRLLLKRGVPVDHVDDLKQSALFYAAREGHANTIRLLLLKGANPNLRDSNGETAIFYAVSKQRDEAVKALLEGGATLEVVNNWHDTCMSKSPTELLPILEAERKKRRGFEDTGSGPKRRRTGVEELRSWAHEWPIKEKVVGEKIDYKPEDIVMQSTDGTYAVVKNAPEVCAARLRVLEKNFVADHAELLGSQPWFGDLTPQEWCKNVGVIADEVANAVDAIKTVVSGNNPQHFTLPLVEAKSKMIAGYVHTTHTPEKNEMSIAHLKVDAKHMGQGLGGLLIEAAEKHSKDIGWLCKSTYLSVLKANVRAQRCYAKAGFKFQSSRPARWGSKEHTISAWERWRKVHKHHFDKKSKKIEKQ
eukprot:Skav209185  [mRNA]  locus=scaffold1137:663386:672772:+ [translate_table: standard]